jgi:ActR/RegA family two-component response regulator
MLLRVEGYEVFTAAGLQVISSIRQLLGDDIKAVLITGDASAALRNLHQDGPVRITCKPINADELLTLLNELAIA